MTLHCTRCDRELPLDAYWRSSANTWRLGRMSWCKECCREHRGQQERGRSIFDPAPLLRLLAARGCRSQRTISDALSISRRQVVRWRAGQRLQSGTADRVATALGLHRSAIW